MRLHPARLAAFWILAAGPSMATIATQLASAAAADDGTQVRVVRKIETDASGGNYVGNRAPLAPSPVMKLPIGSIKPRGWLRHMLELEARGMVGHLVELSQWCRFEGNAWTSPDGQGHSTWEEAPYWLKGFGDVGYVLGEEAIIQETRRWVDAVLASQDDEGWFGPRALKTRLQGKPDLWPHMVMLNVLQSYYEYTGDERVLPLMTNYFKWQLAVPEQDFVAGFWPKMRAGDNIESVYWLYNRTGDKWLLDLAAKIHRNAANWTDGMANWHNVNIAQGFREPAVYSMQAKDPKFLRATERNYETVMDMYGQYPGGGFGGDENCRPGYTDPRQAIETCGVVEFMHSFEMLTKITGDPKWSDLCEEITFNTLPAALTPDLKGLHYLTAPNMVQLDKENKAPGLQNGGTMLSYSPGERYRCCQHNFAHGWPYYAEELWLATADGGLCASLYAASDVTAKVGDGSKITIAEETDYPFSDTIELKISADKAVKFPLYLRVPQWCKAPELAVNGQAVAVEAEPRSYIVVERRWADGDTVTLKLPMQVAVRTWEKNKNSVSVDYGPLTFSLKIGEKWTQHGGTDEWPEYEVFATTPWNYGLVLDEQNPAASFQLVRADGPPAPQPFTPEAAPIQLRAKARKIPGWSKDGQGLVGTLQPSPARTDEPLETVTLIPMGAARLRISSFPVVGSGPDAHEWVKPSRLLASHCWGRDTVHAIADGISPSSSSDMSIARLTWWDHKGTKEWVMHELSKPRKVAGCGVYWFDDSTRGGGCAVPASWRVLYQDGNEWKPVENASQYGVARDKFNEVTFTPVEASAFRLEVQLQPGYSGGILEWKIR